MPLKRAVAAVLLAMLAASCIPPEDAVERFDRGTTLGRIQQRGELIVGIEVAAKPFGFLEGSAPEGWTVEIAGAIAKQLGVGLRLIPAPTEGLLRLLDSGQADVAFPAVGMTEETVRRYAAGDPYWVGHQRLLVPEESGIERFADLSGRRVCATLPPRIGVSPSRLAPDVTVREASISECGDLLDGGRVDAVTASDYHLLGLAAERPQTHIVGEAVTTEGYGPMLAFNASAMSEFVNEVLEEYDGDGWRKGYERWVQPILGGPVHDPPKMTVEEAGALYPTPRITPAASPGDQS